MARAGFVSTLGIAALGVAASLFVWQSMDHQQDVEVERDADVMASALTHVIEASVEEEELNALRRSADFWARQPGGTPKQWQLKTEMFLAEHPAYRAIARMDAGRATDIVASEDGRAILREIAPKAAELLTESETSGLPREVALGPIRLTDGRIVLGVQLAAENESRDPHVLLAILEPGILISRIFERRRARGYAVRVLWGEEEIYRNAEADHSPASEGYWAVEHMRLSLGPEWSVLAHPTPLVRGDTRRSGPAIALVAGLLISALIASLAQVSQTSRHRAAALLPSNLNLRAQVETSARDAAEIRSLNERLEGRVEERTVALQETIAELETFNYSVSHDLRSPLGAILNFEAILTQDYGAALDASGREYLRRIGVSANVAVSLMDGLLAFSRSGRQELHKTEVDVQRLVEDLRDEITAADPKLGCEIKIGELPPAQADPEMLRYIFANLLQNACKFIRKGEPPRVEVGGRAEGDDVVYFVRDEGIGFDMRFADKLFRVFERLHTSEEYEGHGVGLAIVARLVRRHGGRAWAEGAVGKGATFNIRIPNAGGERASRGLPGGV